MPRGLIISTAPSSESARNDPVFAVEPVLLDQAVPPSFSRSKLPSSCMTSKVPFSSALHTVSPFDISASVPLLSRPKLCWPFNDLMDSPGCNLWLTCISLNPPRLPSTKDPESFAVCVKFMYIWESRAAICRV